MTEHPEQRHPGMPPYSPPQHPGTVNQPPLALRRALVLAVANAVWGAFVLFSSLGFVDVMTLRQQADFQGRTMTDGQIQQVIGFVTAGTILFFVVATAVWVLFTVFMYKGRNWARITLTVLAGIWIFATLVSLAMPVYGGIVIKVLLLLQLVPLILLVCWMYQSQANDYFARRFPQHPGTHKR